MKSLKMLVKTFLVLALALVASVACAPQASSQETTSGEWEFEIIPYFWMAGLSGDATIKGSDSHVSMSSGDVRDKLDFGAQAHLEARRDKWGIFFDFTYLDMSQDGQLEDPNVGPVNDNVGFQEWLIELGGRYQLATRPLEKKRVIFLDALGGGRYWYMNADFATTDPRFDSSFDRSASENWFDPFVGLRLGANLTKSLLLVSRGDVGGLGVGSKFSWNASVVIGYSIPRQVSAWMGYRALAVDYENGSGDERFALDMTMYGPMIGVGFYF